MGGGLLGHILRLQGISFMDNFPISVCFISVLQHSLGFPGPAVCSPAPRALRPVPLVPAFSLEHGQRPLFGIWDKAFPASPSSVPNSPSFLFFGRNRQDRGDGERLGVLNNQPHLFLSVVGSSRALGLVYKRSRV